MTAVGRFFYESLTLNSVGTFFTDHESGGRRSAEVTVIRGSTVVTKEQSFDRFNRFYSYKKTRLHKVMNTQCDLSLLKNKTMKLLIQIRDIKIVLASCNPVIL